MANGNDKPPPVEPETKITSDEDWKQQARDEKAKLVEEQKQKTTASDAGESKGPSGPLPAANFMTLVNSLVVQIFYCLGRLREKNSKNAVNLDLAKHHIDMLAVLEEKTKGNLTADESKVLAMALHEARMQYVQAAQAQ